VHSYLDFKRWVSEVQGMKDLKGFLGKPLDLQGFIKGFDNDIGRNLHYYQGNALMIGETTD